MVLDVSDQDKIKLIRVPEGMRERYISLSYCWGRGSQAVMLNKIDRPDLVSGVSLQRLDATIRDSVIVTRQLGFKYLWIDALCIFQDDYEFKARELGRMGEIYRSATFTIVASAAKDVKEGFLTKRKSTLEKIASEFGSPGLVFKTQFDGDGENSIAASPVIIRPQSLDGVEPWYERAWTLQEMLFSGRRLQYRANQTSWSCYCSETLTQHCDGWIGGGRNTFTNYSDVSELFLNTMGILRKENSLPPRATVLSTWYNLVQLYTQRKLTYSTDRLPAISGIAREFGSVLGDQYVCGLWKSDLPSGLVWSHIGRWNYASGAKSGRGPSWSWATNEIRVVWPRGGLWQNTDFEVLQIMVNVMLPSDPFGEIRTAELRVRGLLRLSSPVWDYRGKITLPPEDDVSFRVDFDYANDQRVQPGSGSIFGLLAVVNIGRAGVHGLVLLEEGGKQYSRVGLFDVYNIWPSERLTYGHENSKTERSLEEHQARIRSLWGGEENIREIVLV